MSTHAVNVVPASPAARVVRARRGDDGPTDRERKRMAREHRAAVMAPFSVSEKRALEAAALRRSAA